jgi:hypothetical protein
MPSPGGWWLARLLDDALAERQFSTPLRYRNLNEEIDAFRTACPPRKTWRSKSTAGCGKLGRSVSGEGPTSKSSHLGDGTEHL